jgi:hypothetical protein
MVSNPYALSGLPYMYNVGPCLSMWLMVCRHFSPAPYQVLQEMSLREKRGEAIDAEAALQPQAAKPGGRSRMDLANRLRQRNDRQRQGRTMYSGFVPPYNTQSRVFDASELRRAATQVCTQSPNGFARNHQMDLPKSDDAALGACFAVSAEVPFVC